MGSQARSASGRRAFCSTIVGILLLLPSLAPAQVFVFEPSKDNSIYIDLCTSINFTDCHSNGAGIHLVANMISFRRKALVQFDVSSIPAMSDITAVTLRLHTTLVDPNLVAGTATLQRVTEAWGEGTSDSGTSNAGESGGAGLGVNATAGDATWRFRFFSPPAGGVLWSTEGGSASATISATAPTPALTSPPLGDYATFDSTPQLVADVQAWVDGTLPNNGWLIDTLNGGERWDSREHPNSSFRPLLTVTVPEPSTSAAAIAAGLSLLALHSARSPRRIRRRL